MVKEDLIPLNQRTKEDARRIQSMGGSTISTKKKVAGYLKHLRKKGSLSTDAEKKLVALFESEDVTDVDIMKYIQEMKIIASRHDNVSLMNMAIGQEQTWRKNRFGSKIKVDIDVEVKIQEIKQTAHKVIEIVKECEYCKNKILEMLDEMPEM